MSMALIVSALGALALTSGIALAAAQPSEMAEHPAGDMTRAQAVEMAGRHFERMDANRDGKVDAADRTAAHARRATEMFDRVDADKDGSISRDEWTTGAARMADAHGGPRHMLKMQRPARHMRMDPEAAMTRQDFEKRALAHFDRVDANKDGRISAAERERAHAEMREHSGRR